MSFGSYLKDVKASIRETNVEAVKKVVESRKGKPGDGNGAGPILIDVREKDEWTSRGYIPGAQLDPPRLPRAAHRGRRSPRRRRTSSSTAPAAPARRWRRGRWRELGYSNVSVDGRRLHGLEARGAGVRPAVRDDPGADPSATRATPCCPRSARRGRSSCSSRRCCCLGAGGLGSPSGFYLAAAGVGTLGLDRRRHGRRVEPAAPDPARAPTGSACPRSSRRRRPLNGAEPRREGGALPRPG